MAKTNRLAQEASPYLRQHMYNPVDWYPWGPEALERARREDKPIFLSIGYAACHWCHVMENDAFEVESVAEVLNRHFVSIKVDREERPDLDQLYQGVVQLTGRSGGWPLSVFLTPSCKPFFGGTYFPPEDRYGLPGFTRLLHALVESWTQRRAEIEQRADGFEQGLLQLTEMGIGRRQREVEPGDLVRAASAIVEELDEKNGGFFRAPKFPHPMELSFLLRMAESDFADADARDEYGKAVRLSLTKMLRGGIWDQLGGGFHRYSVDEAWAVPHFEKMLYDNALLLRLYAEASIVFGEEEFARAAREIVDWLEREMKGEEGAFHSSQDADSEGVEGKYFVFTQQELHEILGEELGLLASAHYGVTPDGNFEDGATVLHVGASRRRLVEELGEGITEKLDEIQKRLLEARSRRVAPATDDKVLASWNGLMIGALAAAGRLLSDERMVGLARDAATFVTSTLLRPDGLHRVYREGEVKQRGFLDDHAALAEGLLELCESTGETDWLRHAQRLVDSAIDAFWDDDRGTFYLSPADGEALLARVPSVHDNALPSGGSSLAHALLRLHAMTAEERYGAVAERYLGAQRDEFLRSPFAFGHLLCASWLRARGLAVVAVLGQADGRREALLEAARRGFRPDVIAFASEEGSGGLLEGKSSVDGRPAAWICRAFACEAPRTEPKEVRDALGS